MIKKNIATCVYEHVTLQEILFAESSATEGTSVGPGATVHKHMSFQISRSWKTFVTKTALVRFVLNWEVTYLYKVFNSTLPDQPCYESSCDNTSYCWLWTFYHKLHTDEVSLHCVFFCECWGWSLCWILCCILGRCVASLLCEFWCVSSTDWVCQMFCHKHCKEALSWLLVSFLDLFLE